MRVIISRLKPDLATIGQKNQVAIQLSLVSSLGKGVGKLQGERTVYKLEERRGAA